MATQEIKPLPKVSCFDTDCDNNLHCFGPKKYGRGQRKGGPCNTCGVELIDWERIQKRNIRDVQATIEALQYEYVRHIFWHVDVIEKVRNKVLEKGENGIRLDIRKRIKESIYKKREEIYPWDSTQTSMKKHDIILFGQHATATCCRRCMKYWFEIPYERELNKGEFKFFEDLLFEYVRLRIPEVA